MIDYWQLAKQFKVGDVVQRFVPTNGTDLSPFVGRVTAVHRGIGFVDVQFPFGNERVSAEQLVRVDPRLCMFLPPELDQSLNTYDVQRARSKWARLKENRVWRGHEMPRGFYTAVAQAWGAGSNEVATYDQVWHKFSAQGVDDLTLRDEVAKFYQVGARLTDLRLGLHLKRNAAYWVAQNRQYRVSQGELTAKKPNCPKCGTVMRRATYKMEEGSRVRLFACPKDLFLIKTNSILGPLGEPVGW